MREIAGPGRVRYRGRAVPPADPAAADPARPAPRPAVYFTELRLRNVRCFGDAEQTLRLGLPKTDADGTRHAGWTVLLGENGRGKTTVLECLAAFHKYIVGETLLSESNLQASFNPSIANRHRRTLADAAHAALIALLSPHILTRSGGSTPTLRARLLVLQHSYGSDEFLEKNINALVHQGGLSTDESVAATQQALPCQFYSIFRGGLLQDGTPPAPLMHRGIPVLHTRLETTPRNVADWLKNLDYSAARSTADSLLNERLSLALSLFRSDKLLPQVTDVRFSVPLRDGTPPMLEFLFDGTWIPSDRAAYGYQTLTAWVLDLVARLFEHYPDSDAPLEEPAVVLVDEVELHLHPSWQRNVLRFLDTRFPNVQFVVTTHSPLVAQAAPEVGAELAVLRRDDALGGAVRIDNDPDAVRGWRVDQVLASDLFETPPRSTVADAALRERREILYKPGDLSPADEARLDALEAVAGRIPVGQSREELRDAARADDALDRIRAALAEPPAPAEAEPPAHARAESAAAA